MPASRSPDEVGRTDISVVVACPGPGERAGPSLRGLERALEGTASEVLLVHPAGGAPRDASGETVRTLPVDADALVPRMWAAGFRESTGETVAFTTTHFVVSDAWARELTGALRRGAAGAGGPIRLGDRPAPLDRAIHMLRYAAFSSVGEPGPVEEIPGDNAAYRRDVLERHDEALREGVWDVELHRRLRAEGEMLSWVPGAVVRYEGSHAARAFLRQRFRHGARFGRYRTRELDTPLWRSLMAAPLVPAVLTLRSLGNQEEGSTGWIRSIPALPWLLLSATAWAGGEAWGSWSAARGATLRATEER